jgi:hypothetical protein
MGSTWASALGAGESGRRDRCSKLSHTDEHEETVYDEELLTEACVKDDGAGVLRTHREEFGRHGGQKNERLTASRQEQKKEWAVVRVAD